MTAKTDKRSNDLSVGVTSDNNVKNKIQTDEYRTIIK